MRVLHIGKYWSPHHGGMERFLEDLIRAQRAQGVEAFALVHGIPGQPTPPTDDPAWLRRVPVWKEIAFVPVAASYRRVLARAIAEFKPDFLHIHMPNVSPLWAFTIKEAAKIPWVVHWHSDVVASEHSRALRWLYPFYAPYERAVLERAKLVIATSTYYLKSSFALGIVEEKCVVVPLGIPLESHIASEQEEQSHWLPERMRLLSIGRLTYYKGHDTLIRAVANSPHTQLLIVGEGDGRADLQALIDEFHAGKRIRLLGGVSDTEKHALLASCDLFCLASRERTEAFGIVLLEAMQHKKPLLVSDLPGSGVNEVARADVNAVTAWLDDAEAWRSAIERLRIDAALRTRLGEAGHRRLHAEYDINAVASKLNDIITATLDPDAARPEAHEKPLIVIPAKDEAATIREVLTEIMNAGYPDVLVVDDASNDGTGQIARKAGAIVLRTPLPMGAWGAMQLGIRYAVRHNYTSVVTMDADGQHRASELPRLFRAAMMADVVIGACPGRGSPARKFAWAFFRKLTGFSLEDLTSGFRLYNARACTVLAGEEATLIDYQDMGVLLLLRSAGVSFAEVEVDMLPRQDGVSRIFYSWWAVARYMAETSVLCVAKGLHRSKLRRV